MKKIYTLCVLLILLCSSSLKAQFYSLGLTGGTSTHYPCSLPGTVWTTLFENIMVSGPSREDSIALLIQFGDGTDTTYGFPFTVTTSSGAGAYMCMFRHDYTMAGTFTQKIVAVAKGGAKDSVYVTVKVYDSCSIVKGKLFVDDNGNCSADAGEAGVSWIPVRFVNTVSGDTVIAEGWTDSPGHYACNLPFGTYDVTPLISDFSAPASGDTLQPTCPASGTSTITVSSGGVVSDFAFTCAKAGSFDAFVHVSANRLIPGDTSVIRLWSGDWAKRFPNSCFARSSSITFTLDPRLSYVASYDGTAPTSVSGSVISWTLSAANLNNFSSRIKVATDTSVPTNNLQC